jgi:hypothetical protein
MAALSSWGINFNTGSVSLTFDTAITALNITTSQTSLYLVTNSSATTTTYPLYGVVNGSGTAWTIQLSAPSINLIKSQTTSFTAQNNTFLYISSGTVTSPAITVGSNLGAGSYTADTTSPVLQSFAYQQYGNWNLKLNFNEPVFQNLLTTAVKLQSTVGGGTNYTLTGGTAWASGTSVYIAFSNTDATAIAALTGLATQVSNTYLSVTSSFGSNWTGTNITPVISSVALQASSWAVGSTPGYILPTVQDLQVQGGTSNTFIQSANANGTLQFNSADTANGGVAGTITISNAAPSGGNNGDIWIVIP